jgi:hypothetical protein
MFIPTSAQQLDTKLDTHIGYLLHVPAFFGHLQGGNGQRKTQQWLLCHRWAVAAFKKQTIKLHKNY